MTTDISPSLETTASKKAQLMKDLKIVITDADELLKEVANSTADDLSAARARLDASLTEAKSKLDNARSVLAERAKHAADAADDYVRENPWEVVGVAAAAGLITGFLVSRR